MFSFRGRTTGPRYLAWTGASIAVFVLLLFPFEAITDFASGCDADGCGDLFFIVSALVQPAVTLACLFSLVAPAVRRARDAGLAPWCGLLVPLLFAADGRTLLGTGSWRIIFTFGVSTPEPWYVALGIVAAIALALLPTAEGRLRFGVLAAPLAIAAALATGMAIVNLEMLPLETLFALLPSVRRFLYQSDAYLLAVIGLVFLASALRLRRSPRWAPAPVATGRPPLPLVRLFIVAYTIAAVAMVSVRPDLLGLHFIFLAVLPFSILPTALLYFGAVLGIALLWRQRVVAGSVLLLVFAVLIGTWGYDHWRAGQLELQIERSSASLPPVRPPVSYPTTMYTEVGNLVEIAGITRRIIPVGDGYKESVLSSAGWSRAGDLGEIPPRYLVVRNCVGTASEYVSGLREWCFALSLMDGGAETAIGTYYAAQVIHPLWLPVAARGGWAPAGGEGMRPDELADSVQAFVDKALQGARVEAEP